MKNYNLNKNDIEKYKDKLEKNITTIKSLKMHILPSEIR